MVAQTDADIWGRIIRFSWTEMTPAEARGILRLKFKRSDLNRAHKLGLLAQEARLSKSDREELDRYLEIASTLTIMQSYARRSLKEAKETAPRRKAS